MSSSNVTASREVVDLASSPSESESSSHSARRLPPSKVTVAAAAGRSSSRAYDEDDDDDEALDTFRLDGSPRKRSSSSSPDSPSSSPSNSPPPLPFTLSATDSEDASLLASPSFSKVPMKKQRPASPTSSAAVPPSKAALRAISNAQKAALKDSAKSARNAALQLQKQSNGTFASLEVCVFLDSSLASSDTGKAVLSYLHADKYMTSSRAPDAVPGAVRFSRRDYLAGGATDDRNAKGVDVLDLMLVVWWRPKEFLHLLRRDDAKQDDYPYLRAWVRDLRRGSKKRTRVVLVLQNVVGELNSQWGTAASSSSSSSSSAARRVSWMPTTEPELHDALVWMLLEEQIESVLCRNAFEIAEYVADLTKVLCVAPYKEEITELHCVKKIKKGCGAAHDEAEEGSSSRKNKEADAEEQCGEAWRRILMQVPGVSLEKAANVSWHYPNMRALLDRYDELENDDDKRFLLTNCFAGGGAKNKKLSECVYKLLTCDDEYELL